MKAISFNTEMTMAILEGRKTQTRRPFIGEQNEDWMDVSPFGNVGKKLWVREPAVVDSYNPKRRIIYITYKADKESIALKYPDRLKWEPIPGHGIPNGIFREAARIFLKVTNIRVEKLQDMSPIDCVHEGTWKKEAVRLGSGHFAIEKFQKLWDSIYKAEKSWNANPYVWVCEFERISALHISKK
jgi:hypothetical protein